MVMVCPTGTVRPTGMVRPRGMVRLTGTVWAICSLHAYRKNHMYLVAVLSPCKLPGKNHSLITLENVILLYYTLQYIISVLVFPLVCT